MKLLMENQTGAREKHVAADTLTVGHSVGLANRCIPR